jgi:mannose-6-phosphate isomerase-like protein (cupin superfamily)
MFWYANSRKIDPRTNYGQFSCIEVSLAPRQMGPPPHVHYELDEIMRVLEGTVSFSSKRRRPYFLEWTR